ncbi:hypothetical protein GUITHDRAFT_110907 [Guillardia theta CCMP2712]|uniref:Uncharacterized protein n=1 Tax=Guillardia theta (strain CCMP2712) TaxID=905079 RepID=L1J517_GUITC|nr:hypothetical protein GUITHDRAFT_110907 [Guillardia theta CCMP2712]EKX43180.1 hypothetical protein GUITHDRAFT_110907 [Guillardia theta CCMP2712]|eukprot:XP_005830160.1 hypothetical protein GUITHDRAFT_110907 [Guillardia theta CCMP2712]
MLRSPGLHMISLNVCCRVRPRSAQQDTDKSTADAQGRDHIQHAMLEEEKLKASLPSGRRRGQKGEQQREFDPKQVNAACRGLVAQKSVMEIERQEEKEEEGLEEKTTEEQEMKQKENLASSKQHEPWWRSQICLQISNAKQEGEERERRKTVAMMLADAEQRRRIAEVQAYEMEDEEERLRRREFARLTEVEELHKIIREELMVRRKEGEERERNRQKVIKALRAEEGRMITDRLTLREVEQGRIDPRAGKVRALIDESQARALGKRKQRALFLAGLRLHVQYVRAMEERERGKEGRGRGEGHGGEGSKEQGYRRTGVDQAIFEMYMRDCLDMRALSWKKEARQQGSRWKEEGMSLLDGSSVLSGDVASLRSFGDPDSSRGSIGLMMT